MEKFLDGDGVAERTWQVGYWQHRRTLGGQTERTYEFTAVTGTSLALVDGALVCRDKDGTLIRAFGPTGWDEVSR